MLRRIVGAGVAGFLLSLPSPGVERAPACEDQLPLVLRVALPKDGALAQIDPTLLRGKVADLFRQVYGQHGICRATRRLQVNVAVGNDYQIVDWLAQGKIDAGLTTDVGLALLQERDKLSLAELDPFQSAQVVLQFPLLRQTLHSFGRSATGGVVERSDVEKDFAALLDAAWRASEREGEPEGDGGHGARGALKVRLQAPSHLSTAGFATLLGRANRWLQARSGAGDAAAVQRRQERFWEAFLERTELTFSRTPPPPDPKVGEVLLQSGEELSPSDGFRSHLVLPLKVARELLDAGTFREATLELPLGAEDLLGRCRPAASGEVAPAGDAAPAGAAAPLAAPCEVPLPLRRWLDADPYFGVRTFGFTVGESLALLREHQRTSDAAKLALVLPGGGVKAVYQSRLIDELYGRSLLRNALTPGAAVHPEALPVDAVIGTSGGALLGYFVARLGENGPWTLSSILWDRSAGEPLDSADIFDWGDLLRYLSAAAVFLVFALCLAVFSFQTKRLAKQEVETSYAASRWRLAFALWLPLALAPLVVRAVNGSHSTEHIPASEGLFYLLCTTIAIFADQCFVIRPGPKPPGPHLLPAWPVLLPGLFLVLLPLAPRVGSDGQESWSGQPLLFFGAFGPLVVLAVGLGFILPAFGHRAWPGSFRGRVAASFLELAAALLLGVAVLALPRGIWRLLAGIPFFLLGFVLLFYLFWFGPSVKRRARLGRALPLRGYWAGLGVATLLVVLLCLPKDLESEGCALWLRESRLDLLLGSFLACLGLLITLAGALLWVARDPDYRVEQAREFRSAFGLSLLLVALVNALLFALRAADLGRFSFLELTSGFWVWLLGLSVAVSVAVILAGAVIALKRPEHRLIRGLRFLCSRHPNAILIDRRFVRVALLALGALGWWNLLLAPALYGNRLAQAFLEKAVERFDSAFARLHPGRAPQLGAQFLTPANVLERDGTRYFLVHPPGTTEFQEIARRPGSGAVWIQFRARGGDPAAGWEWEGCARGAAWSKDDLRSVIFASGSPFPIFPAHAVDLPRGDGSCRTERVPLVDGGYSNNEPVEAAAAIGAAQVMVIRSSNLSGVEGPPPGGAAAPDQLLRSLNGPLVGNLSRLAGFLFERAQQPDRLSRRDVFVVSLSPRPRPGWPELFDFRSEVVRDLRRFASQDLGRRIGAVESWGPPRFQLSVEVAPSPPGRPSARKK